MSIGPRLYDEVTDRNEVKLEIARPTGRADFEHEIPRAKVSGLNMTERWIEYVTPDNSWTTYSWGVDHNVVITTTPLQ